MTTTNNRAITVRYNESEIELLESKMEKQRYDNFAQYIKATSLNQVEVIEDIQGKKEVCREFERVRQELIKQESAIQKLSDTQKGLDEQELKFIIREMKRMRNQLEELLNKKLFVK